MSWSPDQYERFREERKQPSRDLIQLIERRPQMRVVDLGCGTGEITRDLHSHLRASETLGIDSSPSMLAKTTAFTSEHLHFALADIETFSSEHKFDLIFSNAALHWIPSHATLLKRLAGFLTQNGQIAIQMPANDEHPSHATAAEVAKELGIAPRHDPLLPIDEYARLLFSIGFRRQHVRMQVYGHELESAASVVEWVKGTLLTDYERRLGNRYQEFLKEYTKRLLERLGGARPFFYTYKRTLMWGSF